MSRSILEIREATVADEDVLWNFLAIAAYEPDAETAKRIPIVASHLEGWPRPGDFGVLAERYGLPLGAAWARQFRVEETPTYFAGPNIPEVSIGVLAKARGNGVGENLLKHLAALAARRGLKGLCLNVRDTNPAIRLYERTGYRPIEGAAKPNRVGGFSLGMLLSIP
jgi:GNAT superfamily N-acetyltransferase